MHLLGTTLHMVRQRQDNAKAEVQTTEMKAKKRMQRTQEKEAVTLLHGRKRKEDLNPKLPQDIREVKLSFGIK